MATRYDRQMPIIGEVGQAKLLNARVGIAGCGGLGTTVVTQLACAGVGYMIMADGDVPDVTNLNRQFVYKEGVKRNKADLLSEWACEVNPLVAVDFYEGRLTNQTIGPLFDQCDIIVDCLDSIATRKFLNKYCVENGKTLVHAGVTGYMGQLTVIVPGETPDLEDLYKGVKDAPKGTVIPSLGSMVSTMASLEATQVIQILTGTGKPFIGRLLSMDLETGSVDIVELQ